MHVPVGRVVIVDRRHKLDGLPITLFKLEHRGKSQGTQIKVFVAVFTARVWAYDHAVVIPAFFGRLINHAVGGLFGKAAVKTKEVAGDFGAVFVPPVRNIANGGLGASAIILVAFAIIGFDNQKSLPPFPL